MRSKVINRKISSKSLPVNEFVEGFGRLCTTFSADQDAVGHIQSVNAKPLLPWRLPDPNDEPATCAMRTQLELTQVQWAGNNLRRLGPVTVEISDIVAKVEMDRFTVLYLTSGRKLFVREPVAEIGRRAALTETERETIKQFKRDIRECKAMGIPVDQAFAALWEAIATRGHWNNEEEARLYDELMDWTKRWLK